MDNDHSPVWEHQAIGRSYRMGQQKEVFVYRFLVEASVETRMVREKDKKVRLADVVVDGGAWGRRRRYWREEDHQMVWEEARVVEALEEGMRNGMWRGRDEVLDRVMSSW